MLYQIIYSIFLLVIIYVLPGISLAYFFSGKLKSNPFFIVFLSLLFVPFLYQLLAFLGLLNLLNWLLLTTGLFLFCRLVSKKLKKSLINSDLVFPAQKDRGSRWLKYFFYFLFISFFAVIIFGKIGLLSGNIPVGDDQPQLQKITSIAMSPGLPLFYNFPTSPLTIYYFNNISAGLLTKFSSNLVTVNVSWFIHSAILILVMFWLIYLLATRLFGAWLERSIVVFGLTWVSGMEFFLWLFRRNSIQPLVHLEWWTDWIGLKPMIHTQISALFTLFFWVPQHLFGALLIIPLFFLVVSSERGKLLTKLFLALIMAALVGYTMFVFITVVLVYGLYLLAKTIFLKEKFSKILTDNFLIVIIGGLLSLPMLLLYFGAEKGGYFRVYMNVFWFLPNNVLFYKPINLILTASLFFLVEFGPLLLAFIIGFFLTIRSKLFRLEYLFWLLCLYIPIWVIFFIRADDDNNISMRSMIPVQIALAVVSAGVVKYLRPTYAKLKFLKIVQAGLVLLFLLPVPTTLFEAYNRYLDSFKAPDPIYVQIDKNLPFDAVVVNTTYGSGTDKSDFVTILGHRFSLKQTSEFTVTDFEYVGIKKISALTFPFASQSAWLKAVNEKPDLKSTFRFYTLEFNTNESSQGAVLTSNRFVVKPYIFK